MNAFLKNIFTLERLKQGVHNQDSFKLILKLASLFFIYFVGPFVFDSAYQSNSEMYLELFLGFWSFCVLLLAGKIGFSLLKTKFSFSVLINCYFSIFWRSLVIGTIISFFLLTLVEVFFTIESASGSFMSQYVIIRAFTDASTLLLLPAVLKAYY